MIEIKPKIFFKEMEIGAAAAILIAYVLSLPKVLDFYGKIPLPIFLIVLFLLHAVVLWFVPRLLLLYVQRSVRTGLHTAAQDNQRTMDRMNRLLEVGAQIHNQQLKILQELKKNNQTYKPPKGDDCDV